MVEVPYFKKIIRSGNGKIDRFCDTKNKNFWINSFICIYAYKVILDIIYVGILTETYILNFYSKYDFFTVAIGALVTIMSSIPIVNIYYQNKFSSITVTLLYLLWFLPSVTFFSYGAMNSYNFALNLVYWIILIYFQFKFPILEYAPIDVGNLARVFRYVGYIFVSLVSASVLYVWIVHAELRLQFDILGVYDIREEAGDYNLPTIVSFFMEFAYLIVPLYMIYFFLEKKYIVGSILIIIIFLNFSIGGHKSMLFLGVVAMLSYLFYNRSRINLFAIGLFILGIAGIGAWYIFKDINIISVIFRRIMFLPADLTIDYIDFFSENTFNTFIKSLSSLSSLGLEAPYSMGRPEIIGLLNYSGSSSNNGMTAIAFSELGIVGIVTFPIIIIIILRTIDFFSNNVDIKITLILACYVCLMMISGGWTSFILSGELFIILALLLILSIKMEKKNDIQ